MARVPTYDVPQESARALPGARETSIASPAAFGRAAQGQIELGQNVLNLAQVWAKEQKRQQDLKDADMTFSAETALREDYLTFENGIRERRGQAAWGATQDTEKWWEEAASKHGEKLENDRQRRLFQQSAAKLRLHSLDAVSKHEAQERRTSLEESAKASIVSSINVAASDPGNEANIATAKVDLLKRVQVISELNGWSPERKAFEESKHLTNLHKQVLQNRIDKDPAGAEAYYQTHKAEISSDQHEVIEKALKVGTSKAKAQAFADAATVAGLTEQQAITDARSKLTGDEEAAAVQEIKTRFAEQRAAREGLQKDAADQAWSILAKTGDVNQVPAAVLAKMDGRDVVALRKEAAGGALVTDWGVYTDLRDMARDRPDEFLRTDLRRYFPQLGKTEREGLLDIQAKLANADDARSVATLSQQIATAHNQLGFGSDDKEKKGQLDSAIYRAIEEEQKRQKRKLSFDERQQIIDRMIIEGEVLSGSMFLPDPNRRYYQVYGTEDAKRFAPNIPKNERAEIEAALKRAGRPVNDKTVLELYERANKLR